MAVLRPALPSDGFAVVPRAWLRDRRLSLKAKGLLSYLLSHEPGYRCSNAQIVRESDDGRDAVRTAHDELERCGYLTKVQTRNAGRFGENDYVLTDPFTQGAGNPTVTADAPSGNPPSPDNPSTGKPSTGNPPHRSTRGGNQQEELPAPAEADDGATRLAVVGSETPTPNQRAHALAREYCTRVPLSPFMGVRNVVVRAVVAKHPDTGDPLYDDDRIRAALAALAERDMAVSTNTLRAALNGTLRPVQAAPAGPYRDAPADAYARPL